MAKLKALLLTEGYHGMISQVEGLAKALNTQFQHKIVRLNWLWNYIPPKFTPKSDIVLKDTNYISDAEKFDLIYEQRLIILISCCFVKHVINSNFARLLATSSSPTPSILAAIIGTPDHSLLLCLNL